MEAPIRILQVVTYMGRGGLETMLMNYYRHMDREKIQFDFLVHRDFEADYDREILSLGGRIFRVSRLVPWSGRYRQELRDFFRQHPEYKIVHVHQDCLSAVALQCAKESGVPVRIAHSHSSSAVKNLKYPIKQYYMKKIPVYATDLLACGRCAGDWMFSGMPYEVVPNAIDVSGYSFSQSMAAQKRRELGLDSQLVIGHVGNFTPAKNHSFLLEVFRQALCMEPSAKLLLVGGGDGMQSAREKAQAMGIADHVIFTGVRSDVPQLMQAMDVFVFPSLYEGLPVTMVEAQAAGLPCVISDRVPGECVVTKGLVTVKKLTDDPGEWAAHILSQAKTPRKDHTAEIRGAGYDIGAAAKNLEMFYLAKSEE